MAKYRLPIEPALIVMTVYGFSATRRRIGGL